MTRRTKGEQKAYLDGYEMCAECIEKYLTDEGKQILECLLTGVRNAVEIEDIEPQESDHKCHTCKHYTSGENDGSCGSYICKGYSNWESEG